MYYVKNISLVFILIGLTYCQTGIKQEYEITAEMMSGGEGDAGATAAGAGAAEEAENEYLYISAHGGCKDEDKPFFITPPNVSLYFTTSLGQESFSTTKTTDGIFPNPGVPLAGSTTIMVPEQKARKACTPSENFINKKSRKQMIDSIVENRESNLSNNFSIYPPGTIVRNLDLDFDPTYNSSKENEDDPLIYSLFKMNIGIFSDINSGTKYFRQSYIDYSPIVYYLYIELMNTYIKFKKDSSLFDTQLSEHISALLYQYQLPEMQSELQDINDEIITLFHEYTYHIIGYLFKICKQYYKKLPIDESLYVSLSTYIYNFAKLYFDINPNDIRIDIEPTYEDIKEIVSNKIKEIGDQDTIKEKTKFYSWSLPILNENFVIKYTTDFYRKPGERNTIYDYYNFFYKLASYENLNDVVNLSNVWFHGKSKKNSYVTSDLRTIIYNLKKKYRDKKIHVIVGSCRSPVSSDCSSVSLSDPEKSSAFRRYTSIPLEKDLKKRTSQLLYKHKKESVLELMDDELKAQWKNDEEIITLDAQRIVDILNKQEAEEVE